MEIIWQSTITREYRHSSHTICTGKEKAQEFIHKLPPTYKLSHNFGLNIPDTKRNHKCSWHLIPHFTLVHGFLILSRKLYIFTICLLTKLVHSSRACPWIILCYGNRGPSRVERMVDRIREGLDTRRNISIGTFLTAVFRSEWLSNQ